MSPRRLSVYLLPLVLPAVVLVVYLAGALQPLSLLGYDALFQLRGVRNADDRIVIIAEDDATIDRYQMRVSDWPRTWHARLIDVLNQAGADLVVFDYDFSRPSQPDEDATFARAIEAAGNVILTNHLKADGGISAPLPELSAHTLGEGFINTLLDGDGSWRRMPYVIVGGDGLVRFSLPLTVVEVYEDFPVEQRLLDDPDYLGWGSHRLPYPDMGINFRGVRGSFNTLSYSQLLENEFDPAQLRGRIVLVGNTHRLGKDFFATPLDRRLPGVEVHANAISSILNDDFIRVVDQRVLLVFIVLAGLLGGIPFLAQRIALARSLALVLPGIIVLGGAGLYLFAARNTWLDTVPLAIAFVANFTAAGLFQWRIARRHASQISAVFGRYVSRNVVDVILSGDVPIELAGHSAEVTVLFSDIRGFTGISEALPPEEVGRFLNRYFEDMIQCVFDHGGTLDKLMGDAVMAFFGAPLQRDDHALAACRCALDMEQRLGAIRESGIVPKGVDLDIGIGINSGDVIAGNLGSESFIDYTVIGDNVNLASRLEGLNKLYGTRIIISEATQAAIGDALPCRELDAVQVKGRDTPTRIYEVLIQPVEDAVLEAYAQALQDYRGARWEAAIHQLDRVLELRPDDGPARVLLEKCRGLMDAGTQPGDWEGVTVLQTK